MKRNPYKGKFIVFEGLDGSGTTTQANLLFRYLKKQGKKVYLTGEPTRSLIGGLIEGQISGDWKSTPECLQLLFTADRAHHLEKGIIPLLKKGITVICTRYILSTLAYGSIDMVAETSSHLPPRPTSEGSAIDEIAEGKLRKYKEEISLMSQSWIRDETKTVKDLIDEYIARFGENIIIKRFVRYEL